MRIYNVRPLRDIRDAGVGHEGAPADDRLEGRVGRDDACTATDRAEEVEQDRDQRTSSVPPSRIKALIDAFFNGDEDSLVIDRDAA